MSRRAGVTLIELLIAVTLVSLLSLAGLMAIRVGLLAMERSGARMASNRRALGAQRALEQQLAGFMPVSAECATGGAVPFFQGEPETMRFASSYSLEEAARGRPRVLEYQVIAGQDGVGVRLVVTEYLYAGARAAGVFCAGLIPDPVAGIPLPRWMPPNPGPGSFVLADKLRFARLRYQERLQEAPFERWVDRWVKREWPAAIRIEMAPLQADPSRIQPMAITIPIRVRKDPQYYYGD